MDRQEGGEMLYGRNEKIGMSGVGVVDYGSVSILTVPGATIWSTENL